MPNRFSTAGLANSAADIMIEQTGKVWRMIFQPRALNDRCPFIVVEIGK
jgi:hypothetical protein